MSDFKSQLANAIANGILIEYEENPQWDEAKDLLENINTSHIVEFVFRVMGNLERSSWITSEEHERLKVYLKDGETFVQRLEREMRDCRQLMKLYAEEKGRREIAEKLIDERAASHVKTTEEWEDEIEHYRRMLSRIASDQVPRVRVHKWREDKAVSKEDRCAHTKAMWEDCSECVAEFATMVLRGAPATRVERDGVWYVPLGPAKKEPDGHSYSLDQLKQDEILVSPGWIYKREVPLVDMGGQLP